MMSFSPRAWSGLRPLVAGLLVTAGVAVAAPAMAQPQEEWILGDRSAQSRSVRIDLMVNAGFFGTLHTGIGAWFSFPVLEDGMIGSLNDELSIEVGSYLQFHNSYFTCANRWLRVTPVGGVKWTWYLTRAWSLFATVKMGISIPFAAQNTCNAAQTQFITVDGSSAIGAYWEPTGGVGLRVEMSNFGPAVGVAIAF